jgi:hypothetical protein
VKRGWSEKPSWRQKRRWSEKPSWRQKRRWSEKPSWRQKRRWSEKTELAAKTALVRKTELVARTALVRKTELVAKTGLDRKTELVAKTGLVRKTELVAKTGLVRKTELVAKTGLVPKTRIQLTSTSQLESKSALRSKSQLTSGSQLTSHTPLTGKSRLKRTAQRGSRTQLACGDEMSSDHQRLSDLPNAGKAQPEAVVRSPKVRRHHKRLQGKASDRSARAPERNPEFLEFVRGQPCDFCGRSGSEAHHWGKHGMATKCSDYLAVPLCHEHHVEGWHRHGTLPGRSREEWLVRWGHRSAELRLAYEELSVRERPRPASRDEKLIECWKELFSLDFDEVPLELDSKGEDLSGPYRALVTTWLRKHVWHLLEDRDEWLPLITLRGGVIDLQVEHTRGIGVWDLDDLLRGWRPPSEDSADGLLSVVDQQARPLF